MQASVRLESRCARLFTIISGLASLLFYKLPDNKMAFAQLTDLTRSRNANGTEVDRPGEGSVTDAGSFTEPAGNGVIERHARWQYGIDV